MKRATISAVACLLLAGCGGAETEEQTAEQSAESSYMSAPNSADAVAETIRSATVQYQDVNAALAAGYIPDPSGECVDWEMVGAPESVGAMGIHYLRPDLLGVAMPPAPGRLTGSDAVIDQAQPEVLVYEPQADGSMVLVAAEYMVFEKAWQDAGNTGLPTLEGEPFVRMIDDPATPMDEAHGFEPHYELHVWVHRDNPSGLFAEFNPNVTCANAPAPAHAM